MLAAQLYLDVLFVAGRVAYSGFSEGSSRDMFLYAGGLYNHWSAAAAIGPLQGRYVTAIICLLYGWLCHSACNIGSDSVLMQFERCLAL